MGDVLVNLVSHLSMDRFLPLPLYIRGQLLSDGPGSCLHVEPCGQMLDGVCQAGPILQEAMLVAVLHESVLV